MMEEDNPDYYLPEKETVEIISMSENSDQYRLLIIEKLTTNVKHC